MLAIVRKQIPWVRLVAEAVAIVASILLAFAIDATWSGQEERQREQELLAALRSDFARNQELLAIARAEHEGHRLAASEFLTLSDPGGASATSDVPDAVLLGLVSWYTYDPVLGSLNSAIASGQLSLIRDHQLRVALAGWVDSVDDLLESEVVDRGHAHDFADVAFDFIPFRSAVYRLAGSDRIGRPSTGAEDHAALLGSLRAENIATNRVAEIGFILSDVSRVERELQTLLELLGEEDGS